MDYYDHAGKRHRIRVGTKTDAVAFRDARKAERIHRQRFPEEYREGVRLAEVIATHVTAVRASRTKTADLIERRLDQVLAVLGNVDATALPDQAIEELKLTLTAGVRKPARRPATINKFLTDLKAALNRARDAETIWNNPFDRVKLLPENNERARELTAEERAAFFAHLQPDPPALRPFFEFLLATGARAGEATGLTWPRVLWPDRVALLTETKAGERQHLILGNRALAILAALPRISSFVFCWPDGHPLTVHYTTHVFRRTVIAADIPDARQHDLRHRAIQRLRGGANIIAISALLRHKSRRSTDRYLHVTRDDLHRAVDAGEEMQG